MSREQDLARARQIAEEYQGYSFEGLLRYAYGELHPEIRPDELDAFVAGRIQRAQLNRARWMRVAVLADTLGLSLGDGIGVDIGCGVGGMLLVLASRMACVVGIDISMEELVFARKYLDVHGIQNATLACVEAEKLPLSQASVAVANATSVLEHVRDPGQVLQRTYDLLAPGGVFVFDTPNRWDLVHPEPHVGIRFVGLWPRALQSTYVRLVSGREYIGKRLLSLPELDRLLHRRVPALSYRVFYWPRWHLGQAPRTFVGRLLLRWPRLVALLNRAWAPFVGIYEVVLWRPVRPDNNAGTNIVPMPYSAGAFGQSSEPLP